MVLALKSINLWHIFVCFSRYAHICIYKFVISQFIVFTNHYSIYDYFFDLKIVIDNYDDVFTINIFVIAFIVA